MKIVVSARLREIKAGWSAEAENLRLAAHGGSPDQAVAALKRRVVTFALALGPEQDWVAIWRRAKVRIVNADGPAEVVIETESEVI